MIKVQINFLSLEESLGVVVEPAVVVGLDVAPSRLDFVAEVPQELTLHCVVEDVGDAVAEDFHLGVVEVGGV